MRKEKRRRRYPIALRIVIFFCAILAIRAWGRLWVALEDSTRYQALKTAPPLFLYVGANLWWSLVFSLMVVGLWKRYRWTHQWLGIVFILYALFSLVWFKQYTQSPYDQARFPFVLISTVGAIGIVLGLLQRPHVLYTFYQRQPTQLVEDMERENRL
jgi:hypothetical protein